jgi:hypothetical protein
LKVEPARDLSQQRFHVCAKTHLFKRSCLLAPPCKDIALSYPSIANANPDFSSKPLKNRIFRHEPPGRMRDFHAFCVKFTRLSMVSPYGPLGFANLKA